MKEDFNIQEKLYEEKTRGFPWVAEAFAKYKASRLDIMEENLRNKNNPAIKGADAVREARNLLKQSEKRAFMAEGIIKFYETLFPWLPELQDAPDNMVSISYNATENEDMDPARDYLTHGEWDTLSTSEKFQISLDRYWKKEKSNWEIGRLYERYIGYLYETDGWDVTYFGAIKGLEDMGRDLIAKKMKKWK